MATHEQVLEVTMQICKDCVYSLAKCAQCPVRRAYTQAAMESSQQSLPYLVHFTETIPCDIKVTTFSAQEARLIAQERYECGNYDDMIHRDYNRATFAIVTTTPLSCEGPQEGGSDE